MMDKVSDGAGWGSARSSFKSKQGVDSIAIRGKKNQTEFLLYAIKIIRDCLLFNFSDRNLLKTNQQETEFISKFTKHH